VWNLLGDGPITLESGTIDPRSPALPLFGYASDGGPLEWQQRALCPQTDPEAFFPEKGGSTREAKRVCSGCEVRAECLEYALANDERFGIWGGYSERERRRLKARRL
jgi:WhiB family redox-sensing transcriptional regulator